MKIIEVNGEIAYECKYYKNYFITKSGQLYSIYVKGGHGKVNINNPHRVVCGIDKDGYYRVVLSYNKQKKYKKIHTIVAEQFIGDIIDGMVVNHKDGNIHNNNYTNLEIVTPRENIQHAWRTGLARKEQNPNRIKVDIFNKETNELIHLGSLDETRKYIGCSIRYIRYIKDVKNICYSYCYLEKVVTGIKNTDYYLKCYFNGKLIKVFKNNQEAAEYFNKKSNTISYYVKSCQNKNKLLNNFIITFPNVSTIENLSK